MVLDWVAADPRLTQLHVVVLTGSNIEERMLRDFEVPAASFFRKPVDFAQLVGLIRNLEQFSIVVDRSRPAQSNPV